MEQKTIELMWKEYKKHADFNMKQQLITYYVYLVKIVAGRLGIYLNHYVDLEDLVGYGIIGLIDAIDKFDQDKNVKFDTYASLRIRGAILDEIRKLDWVPRSLRKKQKDFTKMYTQLENTLGRTPLDEEMAKALDVSKEVYYQLLQETNVSNLISLDEYEFQGNTLKDEDEPLPEEYIQKQEIKDILTKSIEALPEREKTVITLYYFEELTLKEISSILEVSESRISQLHTKAVSRLKGKLANYHVNFPL